MTTPDPNKTTFLPEKCLHTKFHATVDVQTDTRIVFVSVLCKLCGQPMQFADGSERVSIQGYMR